MKVFLTFCLCLMAVLPMRAQTMADVLRTMPDSIFPLLTQNDRLDLVDEWQGGVKAEVRNRLGGMVTLTEMSDTRAVLQMSSISSVTLDIVEQPDSQQKAIRLTFSCTADGLTNRYERRFTMDWRSK